MKRTLLFMLVLMIISLPYIFLDDTDGEDVIPKTIVHGTVSNIVTGSTVGFARIEIWTSEGFAYSGPTDENGNYSYELKMEIIEELDIFCSCDGYHDKYRSIEIRFGETKRVDFELEPMNSSVSGYVYSSQDFTFIYSAYVSLYPTEPGGEEYITETYGYGRYEIFADPGYYKLVVKDDYNSYYDHISDEFYLDDGDHFDINVDLVPITSGVKGHVHDTESEPIEDGSVHLIMETGELWKSVDIFEGGEYNMRAPPGKYVLRTSVPNHFNTEVEVEIGEDEWVEQDIELEPMSPRGWIERLIIGILDMIGVI